MLIEHSVAIVNYSSLPEFLSMLVNDKIQLKVHNKKNGEKGRTGYSSNLQ
jgi:hypothetical protein